MQIIDGYCGVPNIYADDIGEYNISMYGEGDYVLPVGEKLGYELVSNNEVKIKDGIFITQGRRGLIKKGSTESCAIENGTQDEKRNDLIVIEYAKDGVTQEESHTLNKGYAWGGGGRSGGGNWGYSGRRCSASDAALPREAGWPERDCC